MSTTPITAIQPSLFDLTIAYTEADRVIDRELCKNYLEQWAGSFKSEAGSPTEISTADFKAAAMRLTQ